MPHVRLPVQRFGQRDLPIVHIDVELPLQVCVPIDEVPAQTVDLQKFGAELFVGAPSGIVTNRDESVNLQKCEYRKSVII